MLCKSTTQGAPLSALEISVLLILISSSCYTNGSLSLITMPISRHTRNIRNSPSHSASITVWTSPPAASRARVSLIGNVTFLESRFAVDSGIQDCYLGRHPVSSHLTGIVAEVEHVQDARWWLPDDPDAAHTVRVLNWYIPVQH